ncbi:hypothetical protein ACEPAI_8577 [Sanghuangporus weigelae]
MDENGTVLNYLESNSDTDLLKLITGIAEETTFLHLNDIVHSDIKPDNVVISDAGEAASLRLWGFAYAGGIKVVQF